MIIVFDTNVVVRAINRPGGSASAVLQRALALGHFSVVSDFLLTEIKRVLDYPRVKALAKNTEPEQQAALEIFRGASLIVEPGIVPGLSTDPDDDPIIALASAAGADVLCTLDKHFQQPAVIAFLTSKGIRVLTDVELLAELNKAIP